MPSSAYKRVAKMLNNGTILPGNSEIMHLLIFGKTRAGEVIKDWKSEEWYLSAMKAHHREF